MKFKNYLRNQLIYVFIYIVSILLVIGIMMLELIIRNENLNFENVFYALFLSVIKLIIENQINQGIKDKGVGIPRG